MPTAGRSRFLVNAPEESGERPDEIRLMKHMEEAYWFYTDHYQQHNPNLPLLNFVKFTDHGAPAQ